MKDIRRTLTYEQRAKVESALGQSCCPSSLAQCNGVPAAECLPAKASIELSPELIEATKADTPKAIAALLAVIVFVVR